jgi:hypothetical protein
MHEVGLFYAFAALIVKTKINAKAVKDWPVPA